MYIEFGTSTHAIAGFGPPGKSFRRSLEESANCGYSHFMLLTSEAGPKVDAQGNAPNAFINVLESDLDALVRAVSAYGLRISSVYPGFGLFDLSKEGIPKTIEKLKRYREIAWRLGCHLMIHPAGVAEGSDTPLESKKRHIEALAQIMDAIASDNPGEIFKMAADVHFGATLQTTMDCTYFFEQSKKNNMGLCLNMGHMTTSGQNGWELLEHFPQRIHVLAWKDHLIGPDLPQPVVSVELGKGKTPFKMYIEAYRKVDCRAVHMVTFEDVPFEEKKEALRRSREYLVDLFWEARG